MNHHIAGVGPAADRRGRMRDRSCLLAVAAALAALLGAEPGGAPPARAQGAGAVKPVPMAERWQAPPSQGRGRPAGSPREIGQIIELTDAARQSGVLSMRHVRRAGNALYDWLTHLRTSIVENNRRDIEYDRANCQLLYELLQESNPSAALADDIRFFRQHVGRGLAGDPMTAFLRLQLDLGKYRFLYPLRDLEGMAAAMLRLQRDGKQEERDQAIDLLLKAIRLPNVDGPIERSFDAYLEGLAALDRGDRGEARRLLKNAAHHISHLNVGTYIEESNWYLAKAEDALSRDLGGIALASVRDANTLLKRAEERAWSEFRPRVKLVREDSDTLVKTLKNQREKTTLTPADLRALARRIEAELRLPS